MGPLWQANLRTDPSKVIVSAASWPLRVSGFGFVRYRVSRLGGISISVED